MIYLFNGNISCMKTLSHALVAHILENIATIAKCKYFERYIRNLVNDGGIMKCLTQIYSTFFPKTFEYFLSG